MVTDHKPLTTIFGPNKGILALAAAHLQHWWRLLLSVYCCDIQFKPTDKHRNADRLSCLPVDVEREKEVPGDVEVFTVAQVNSLLVTAQQLGQAMRSDTLLSKGGSIHGMADQTRLRRV